MAQGPIDLQEMRDRLFALEFQLLRSRRRVAELQAQFVLQKLNRTAAMPIEFTAQFGEDLLIWDLLGQQTSGFFIEAGAFDGYRYSVTYPLEAVGWHGLLVEAIPEAAATCAISRKGSKVVHSALGARGCPPSAEFWVVEDQYGGIFSYSRPTPGHLQRIADKQKKRISVPLACLDDLLADHHGEIDLLVLDVEGAEMDVLAGFDVERFRPRVMLIEDNSRGQDPALNAYIQKHPYKMAGQIALNNIYIRNDQTEVFDRLKWMMMT